MPRTRNTGQAGSAAGNGQLTLAPITNLPPQDVKRFLEGMYELIESEASAPERGQRPGSAQRYTLKIQLAGTKPPVWRRIEVPSTILLSELHHVVVAAMGWSGAHQHQFATCPPRGQAPETFVADGTFAGPRATHEGQVTLGEVLHAKGGKLAYEYDFADSWRHVIRLEQIADDEATEVTCLTGRRACPPEDCGGVQAFQRLLTWASQPASDLTTEQVVRLRHHAPYEGWNPADFDRDAVNEALASRAWARTRRARRLRQLSA